MRAWLGLASILAAAALVSACATVTTNLPSVGDSTRPDAGRGGPVAPPTTVMVPPPTPSAFQGRPPPSGPAQTIKVALLVPLTGQHAAAGRDLLDAAQIALFDVATRNFEMLPYDTGGTPDGAARAAQQALQDGASLVLGPLLSGSVRAAAPIVRGRGVPVVAFSNDLSVAGDGVFTMGFVPQDQVHRVVDYALANGLTRIAALLPNDRYGLAMFDAVDRAVPGRGGGLVDARFYTFGEVAGPSPVGSVPLATADEAVRGLADYDRRVQALNNYRASLERRGTAEAEAELARLANYDTMDDPDFEAIFLPTGGEDILRLAPLLAFYDVDPSRVRFLGTWLWDDPTLRAEPTMVGAWFAAPPPSARENFIRTFERTYDRTPDRRATLAYDAVAMAAILAARSQGRFPYDRRAMTVPNGFAGTDGIFRLLPSGRVERGLAVLEIQPDGVVVRDPAPRSFGQPLTR